MIAMATHSEEILNIRQKVAYALKIGLFDQQHAEFFQQTLLEILNESERARQRCVAAAQHLREQAAAEEAKAQAFATQLSIVNAVLHGYVRKHEQAEEESKRVEAENAEKAAAAKEAEEPKAEEVSEEELMRQLEEEEAAKAAAKIDEKRGKRK